MFIIVNRHKEILATDDHFYPAEAFPLHSAKTFPTEEQADHYRSLIREYTRVVPTEASL